MSEYLLALSGGLMIGFAAVALLLLNGKIMGVSGIVSRLLPPVISDWQWRIAFVVGTLASALIATFVFQPVFETQITDTKPLLLIAGLLVGIGTVVGNGCTSGHGVCGLPRHSPRSAAATAVFMLVAMATVFIFRHAAG